jgi:recombination associated protein RdgC
MWLKQFQAFEYSFDFTLDLAPKLEQFTLGPCPAHARMTHGWKLVDDHQLSLSINDFHFCYFGKEERILPAAVIQNELEKRAQSQGQDLKRHEKQQMKQDVEFDLLPKAFCIQKKVALIFDQKRKRLFIESSSPQQLEMILAYIYKTLGQSASITPVNIGEDLNRLWQKWLVNPLSLPHFLKFADRMQWIDADNPQKQIRCQGLEWLEEQHPWLEQGLIPKELSFVWRERIQFNLNAKLQFKRLQALEDFAQEDMELEDKEAELLILGKQLQNMLDDLTQVFSPQGQAQSMSLEIS